MAKKTAPKSKADASPSTEKRSEEVTKNQNQTASEQTLPQDKKKDKKKAFPVKDLIAAILNSLAPDPPEGATKSRDKLIRRYLKDALSGNSISQTYNILILHDEGRMMKSDTDHIYSAAADFKEEKPLLLVLYSTGGDIGSAYLIGKLCREYSNGTFIVVVPRQAKSGAALICCGADQIHMGSLSELGPIDPQIRNTPALSLKSSVEHIADLINKYPQASDMFAKYLNLSLEPIYLGYFERVAESSTQYAERLLNLHSSELKHTPSNIAKQLVYSYKDHNFVIDKAEAADIFGEKVVKTNTPEYALGNELYERLMSVSRFADLADNHFYFIGSVTSEPHFYKKKR